MECSFFCTQANSRAGKIPGEDTRAMEEALKTGANNQIEQQSRGH